MRRLDTICCFLRAIVSAQNVWKTLVKRESGEILAKASRVAFDQVAESDLYLFSAITPVANGSNTTRSSLSNEAMSLIGSSVTFHPITLI